MNKIYFLLLIIFLFSCSSKEITQNKNEYIFDKVELDSTDVDKNVSYSFLENSEEFVNAKSFYIVQIGAFTTEQRAKKFAEKSRKILNEEIIISFSDRINLYLVQLEKKFNNKFDAEIVKNNLRLFPEFQDAWIISINE